MCVSRRLKTCCVLIYFWSVVKPLRGIRYNKVNNTSNLPSCQLCVHASCRCLGLGNKVCSIKYTQASIQVEAGSKEF